MGNESNNTKDNMNKNKHTNWIILYRILIMILLVDPVAIIMGEGQSQ